MDVQGNQEKHHVAWPFPILNQLSNDFCVLVDCMNLLSFVNDSVTLEVTSVDNTSMISGEINVDEVILVKVRKWR